MIEFPLIHENFYCVPYSGIEHRTALHRFDVLDFVDENGNTYAKDGLQNAINNDLANLDESNQLKTYLVYGKDSDGNERVAGVFSLRCSSINFHDDTSAAEFNEISPAIELVYLAVEKQYRSVFPETKGLGHTIFNAFVDKIVKEIASLAGAEFLFLFAINNEKLVRHYKRKMFFDDLPEEQESAVINSLATKSNQECKFLYQYI